MDQEGYVSLAFESVVDIRYDHRMLKGVFRWREELEQKKREPIGTARAPGDQLMSAGEETGVGQNGRYKQ